MDPNDVFWNVPYNLMNRQYKCKRINIEREILLICRLLRQFNRAVATLKRIKSEGLEVFLNNL